MAKSFFGAISDFAFAKNKSTLSGAIDIVAIRQSDEKAHSSEPPSPTKSFENAQKSDTGFNINCTPWHVRFGKLSGIMNPKERVVQIACNGVKTSLKMKLGDAGEAFFVEEADDLDETYATSPIVSPLSSPEHRVPSVSPLPLLQLDSSDGSSGGDKSGTKHDANEERSGSARGASPTSSVDGTLSPQLVQFSSSVAASDDTLTSKKPVLQPLESHEPHGSPKSQEFRKPMDIQDSKRQEGEEHEHEPQDKQSARRKEYFKSDNFSWNFPWRGESLSEATSADKSSISPSQESNSGLSAAPQTNTPESSDNKDKKQSLVGSIFSFISGGAISADSTKGESAKLENVNVEGQSKSSIDAVDKTDGHATTQVSTNTRDVTLSGDASSQPLNESVNLGENNADSAEFAKGGQILEEKEHKRHPAVEEEASTLEIKMPSVPKTQEDDRSIVDIDIPASSHTGGGPELETKAASVATAANEQKTIKESNHLSLPKIGRTESQEELSTILGSDSIFEERQAKIVDNLVVEGDSIVIMSLCGKEALSCDSVAEGDVSPSDEDLKIFMQKRVSADVFHSNPLSVLQSPMLIVLVNSRMMPWAKAAPHLLSLCAFPGIHSSLGGYKVSGAWSKSDFRSPSGQTPTNIKSGKPYGGGSFFSGWFSRSSSSGTAATIAKTEARDSAPSRASSLHPVPASLAQKDSDLQEKKYPNQENNAELPKIRRLHGLQSLTHKAQDESSECVEGGSLLERSPPLLTVKVLSPELEAKSTTSSPVSSSTVQNQAGALVSGSNRRRKQIYYRKTLRPTQFELASLNLKDGENTITFSVKTRRGGVSTLSCALWYWPADVSIVISDVDGTITRSDVMGQVMPAFGRDWSHEGVVSLYNDIKNNGYSLVYLSSRPIGQSGQTKKYLTDLRQDGKALPPGPLIVSPDRLLRVLAREVYYRRAQEFKIAALRDLKRLFPVASNPFYAGFGNRPSDVASYGATGVPSGKIFIIDTQSKISSGNGHTLEQNYTSMHKIADLIFPPIVKPLSGPAIEGKQSEDNQGNSTSKIGSRGSKYLDPSFNSAAFWGSKAGTIESDIDSEIDEDEDDGNLSELSDNSDFGVEDGDYDSEVVAIAEAVASESLSMSPADKRLKAEELNQIASSNNFDEVEISIAKSSIVSTVSVD